MLKPLKPECSGTIQGWHQMYSWKSWTRFDSPSRGKTPVCDKPSSLVWSWQSPWGSWPQEIATTPWGTLSEFHFPLSASSCLSSVTPSPTPSRQRLSRWSGPKRGGRPLPTSSGAARTCPTPWVRWMASMWPSRNPLIVGPVLQLQRFQFYPLAGACGRRLQVPVGGGRWSSHMSDTQIFTASLA